MGGELAWLGGGAWVSGSVGRRRGLASMYALHVFAVEAGWVKGWTRRQCRYMPRRRHARRVEGWTRRQRRDVAGRWRYARRVKRWTRRQREGRRSVPIEWLGEAFELAQESRQGPARAGRLVPLVI